MDLPFRNRRKAGRILAPLLADLAGRGDLLVLGLPRGGIPVAHEVAHALNAPLDAYIVRKLGVPGHEELAMGAIASGNVQVLNDDIVSQLGIGQNAIDAVIASEQRELERRERHYRGSRPDPDVEGRTVVLADDGLATGTTMLAAVRAVRQLGAREVIVAVPVASASAVHVFDGIADRVTCAHTPEPFFALGQWYEDFSATTDNEVQDLLAGAASRPAPPTRAITARAWPIVGSPHDHDRLLDAIGEARFVLIGEGSHGTMEFYRERAAITRRLIEELGFHAVAVEADWPDAFRVNRFVRGTGSDRTPDEALGDFRRFPQWMWRNLVVRDVIGWLHEYNQDQEQQDQAGFYGLDLYSLHGSIGAVIDYLESVDPEAARRARVRYSCLDHYGGDAQHYGYAVSLGAAEPCEDDVVSQLADLRQQTASLAMRDGQAAADAFFSAEQNARLARNAEAYYRAMFQGRVSSWNLRDTHMADTLDALADHLQARNGVPARIVVWAHNSHLGDARATQMGDAGEIDLGQLVRERHGNDAFLIGQTTHHGTVTAAPDWGEPARHYHVQPGLEGSCEALFHQVGIDAFTLPLGGSDPRLDEPLLQRAIGVIYRPETERTSHYFETRLARQFDAVIHIDRTSALQPLDQLPEWNEGDAPEGYPFAGEPLPGGR